MYSWLLPKSTRKTAEAVAASRRFNLYPVSTSIDISQETGSFHRLRLHMHPTDIRRSSKSKQQEHQQQPSRRKTADASAASMHKILHDASQQTAMAETGHSSREYDLCVCYCWTNARWKCSCSHDSFPTNRPACNRAPATAAEHLWSLSCL